jgi:hypothetical protein
MGMASSAVGAGCSAPPREASIIWGVECEMVRYPRQHLVYTQGRVVGDGGGSDAAEGTRLDLGLDLDA